MPAFRERHPVYNSRHALRLLRRGTGIPDAVFRPGQEEAIRHVVEGHGRLLVVQKTGWGKSFVYFIATRLLREAGRGPALLVSPLLSLMRNQIAAARRMGGRAEQITSGNQEDWPAVEELLRRDDVDILLIAPERLANERFRSEVLAGIAERISLLVIDECHCISDWGHDFRPHYRLIERVARTLPRNMRLLATTATANDRVMNDLREVLGPHLDVHEALAFLRRLDLPIRPRLRWPTPGGLNRYEVKGWIDRSHRAEEGRVLCYWGDGSFAVHPIRLPSDPVLLVDDIVGSRWTFTVAAWLLRRHGSGRVLPLALSSLGSG